MYVDGGQSLYAQLFFEVPGEWSGNESAPLCGLSYSGFHNSSRYLRDKGVFFFFFPCRTSKKNVQNIYSHHMILKGNIPSAENI